MTPSWRRSPCVRIGTCLLAGIGIGRWVQLPSWLTATHLALLVLALCVLAIILSVIRTRKPQSVRPGLVLFTAFCTSGFIHSILQRPQLDLNHYLHANEPGEWIVEIAQLNQQDSARASLIGRVLHVRADNDWQPSTGKLLVQIYRPLSTFAPGDLVYIPERARPLPDRSLPFAFDYGAYLQNKEVYRQVNSDGQKIIAHTPPSQTMRQWLHQWREALKERIGTYIQNPDARSVLYALVLGDDREIDRDLSDAYSAAGTVHLLAVSGLHVGMIYAILAALCGRLLPGKRTAWMRFVIQASLLWMYAGLTGFSPSVLRASVMFSFFLIAAHTEKQNNSLNTLFASAILLLWADPIIAGELGFQLSYLAVAGILLFQKPIEQLVFVQNPLLRNAWALSSVSISAQLTTLPLTVYTFGQFPVYFLIANLLVIPIATATLYLGVLFLALSHWSATAKPLASLLSVLTTNMNAAIRFIGEIPGSTMSHLNISGLDGVLLCVCVAGVGVVLLGTRKPGWWMIASSVVALLLSSSHHASKIVALHEHLLWETNGQVMLVSTQHGQTIVYGDADGHSLSHRHPLRSYLTHLGTPVHCLPWPDQSDIAWMHLRVGEVDEGVVIFQETPQRVFLPEDTLRKMPCRTWSCVRRLPRSKQRFLHTLADSTSRRWMPLSEGALVKRDSDWVHFSTYY